MAGCGGPELVLQSSGRARLRRDRWAGLIESRGIKRLVSDRVGTATVVVGEDGTLSWTTYRDAAR
ncbi:hypothetical protein [Algisphaera agarilytica]|uniref:Uncharacterized protein n=1 Tax=Algisphaera agarilytica TaxID=1385975 RepID=A0A7X0LKA3_9BACT|nr:hypothetical protein [Algisphaera agarilytica]MBB6428733.1 hypothetical protein [Algisphaera agarilytica]